MEVVVVGGGGGGGWITYPLPYNTSPRLGAGTLMLNAWTGLLQYGNWSKTWTGNAYKWDYV